MGEEFQAKDFACLEAGRADPADTMNSDISEPGSPSTGPLRAFLTRRFESFLGIRGASPDDRKLILAPTVAALRQLRTWFFPGLVSLLAAGALSVLWNPANIQKGNPFLLFVRVVGLEVLFVSFALVDSTLAARRIQAKSALLQELYLTELSPRTLALSSVTGTVVAWAICVALLAPFEAVLVFHAVFLPRIAGPLTLEPVLVGVVFSLLSGGLFAWFHINGIRVACWYEARHILPSRDKPPSDMRMGAYSNLEMELILDYLVLLVFFSVPLMLMAVGAVFLFLRLFGVETPFLQLLDSPEVQLAAWLFVAGFFVLVKRRVAGSALELFFLHWSAASWWGIAEPDAPSPPRVYPALHEWRAFRRATARIEAGRRGGRFARWRARVACGRYRWSRANCNHLDPDSHRFIGRWFLRREFVEPGDDLALERPDIPLPYDPNPDRVFGTPLGGPDRLESPTGSVVERAQSARNSTRRSRYRNPFRFVPRVLIAERRLSPIAALIVIYYSVAWLDPTARPWAWLQSANAYGVWFVPAVFLVVGLVSLVLLRSGTRAAGWLMLRIFLTHRLRARHDRLFAPRESQRFVFVQEAPNFHRYRGATVEFALVRVVPGWLEMEMAGCRARLRAEEVQLQIQESTSERAVLLTVRFGETLWAVSLQPSHIWPSSSEKRARRFRAWIRGRLNSPPGH